MEGLKGNYRKNDAECQFFALTLLCYYCLTDLFHYCYGKMKLIGIMDSVGVKRKVQIVIGVMVFDMTYGRDSDLVLLYSFSFG